MKQAERTIRSGRTSRMRSLTTFVKMPAMHGEQLKLNCVPDQPDQPAPTDVQLRSGICVKEADVPKKPGAHSHMYDLTPRGLDSSTWGGNTTAFAEGGREQK